MESINVSTQASPVIKRKRLGPVWKYRYLYLLGLPGMVYFILFKYAPMYGLVIVFQDYSPFLGVMKSDWVGWANFTRLVHDPDFWRLIRNSFTISSLSIVISFPAPILLSLIINEVRNHVYKRVIQTVIYLPHFLSWVIVFSLTYLFLSSEIGFINKAVVFFGGESHSYLQDSSYFYPIVIMQELWKDIGWGTIIYLAAIAGVNPALYEAAKMDGAGKFKQMLHITFPSIMPTVVVLFILKMGSMLDVNFEQLILLQNPAINHLAEVFDTYVYKTGIQNPTDISYSTTVGIFKSIVALFFVLGANYIVRKRGHEGLW
jgi:putative aldouronate transport system permease protein